ncbi:DUF2515 family protein [Halalkalibacter kiskunsagensis]|uniref:DUF2515 family protein n=1 Tax=Halalkalibacter kiskunsagensis TaxID=1548599 RepID=A0ABV6KI70_9BACI
MKRETSFGKTLKGDLLSRLLSGKEQKEFFHFLERGNWLIFQDVYPQMLLYEESINRHTNLFYLLPRFDVSKFMYVLWNHFWQTKDRYTLAIALVINEQSYLEKRVIQNPLFQKTVLETLKFQIQELFSLNQILFPYKKTDEAKVIGQSIYHFSSLHDRILLGKRLYDLLFDETFYEQIYNWSIQQPHTGSRQDYWPEIFNDLNESTPEEPFKRRTRNCKLKPGANRIYSPKLQFAWSDVDHVAAEKGDWYQDWTVLQYLQKHIKKVNGDIYEDYCETLERIELAIIAKNAFLS